MRSSKVHSLLKLKRANAMAQPSEENLTPSQVERAREAIDFLSSIPFRGNVRDTGIATSFSTLSIPLIIIQSIGGPFPHHLSLAIPYIMKVILAATAIYCTSTIVGRVTHITQVQLSNVLLVYL